MRGSLRLLRSCKTMGSSVRQDWQQRQFAMQAIFAEDSLRRGVLTGVVCSNPPGSQPSSGLERFRRSPALLPKQTLSPARLLAQLFPAGTDSSGSQPHSLLRLFWVRKRCFLCFLILFFHMSCFFLRFSQPTHHESRRRINRCLFC